MIRHNDLTIFMTIEDSEGTVSMSAGYDPNTQEYYMPSLVFTEMHVLGADYWDAPEYIFETFYTFLKRWEEKMLTIEDKEQFPEWLNLNEEQVSQLLDIFEQAIKFGWDKLKL